MRGYDAFSRESERTQMLNRHSSPDIVSPRVRSKMMRAVRQQRTTAEIRVRKIVRSTGASFCIRNKNLPGSPDLANRRRKWAIFVHGCFWHGHKNCKRGTSLTPKTNAEFWAEKFRVNRMRDAAACWRLRRLGFRVAIVWECSLSDELAVFTRLQRLIESTQNG